MTEYLLESEGGDLEGIKAKYFGEKFAVTYFEIDGQVNRDITLVELTERGGDIFVSGKMIRGREERDVFDMVVHKGTGLIDIQKSMPATVKLKDPKGRNAQEVIFTIANFDLV